MEVQQFSSFEEMQEWMRKQEAAAQQNLHPKQSEITWGSHWVRFFPTDGSLLVIFGYVDTLDEAWAKEVKYGAEAGEEDYFRTHTTENHARGYMQGTAYSVVEPMGEPGDTHRYNAWPISQLTFDAAKEAGWQMSAMDQAHLLTLGDIYSEWSAWQQREQKAEMD